jgi:tRNA G18 (ribose-2'-O)-methylase SpoU
MFEVQKIDSFENPDLWPYRTMRLQEEHRQQQIFVAEGEKVVRRLLQSNFTIVSLVLPEKWFFLFEPMLQARPENLRVYLAEKDLLEQLTGFTFFQGVLAVAKIPGQPSMEELIESKPRPLFLAAADGICNAENIGVLARNCAAFGVQALLIGETSASPYLRRSVRSSMGTLFKSTVLEVSSLVETLKFLQRSGIKCLAAHPSSKEVILPESDLKTDCCLVFGSEGLGLTREILETCDEAVAVPMAPEVDSLNVGSASAVFLYEVARQRGFQSSTNRPPQF